MLCECFESIKRMCAFSFFVLILYLFLTKKFVFVYFLKFHLDIFNA